MEYEPHPPPEPSAPLRLIEEIWYGRHWLSYPLIPFGWMFRFLVAVRRLAYGVGILRTHWVAVPVIVVGNLTVGGTGKTPLTIWICNLLQDLGYRPGIVSRGYGGQARHWPQQVRPDSDPQAVGDEPILLARRTGCPVAVAPDRVAAAQGLVEYAHCDILVCDDGLQHYRLGRDIEIAVVDGIRRFGNGRCLPAGPLRESAGRLRTVDLVVTNGIGGRAEFNMRYHLTDLVQVGDEQRRLPLERLREEQIHAVAGIGHPERFFADLRAHGIKVIEHPFPDHHVYEPEELAFDDELPVVMTEKDAVKCRRFHCERHWYVPIEVELPRAFEQRLLALLKEIPHGQETAGHPGVPGDEGTARV